MSANSTFQPIHNPYIVGNPIKDRKMFFGREDDFTYIQQKITGGKTGGLLVLCGSRRSGKTSILFQIMGGRLGDEYFPVLVDMQAMTVENDLDFLIRLGREIITAIGDPELSIDKDFLAKRGEGSLAAFQNLIEKINSSLRGRKLVLLIDEYEIIESHIDKKFISIEILNLLANWIEHKEGVFMVFTGSDKLEERNTEYWAHFLGKALHRRISFLSRDDSMRLITEPLRDVIHYEEGLPDQIYALTAGQPFYTQVFCQALVDHLNEVRDNKLGQRDLKDVIDQIIENPLPQMIFSWNSLASIEKITLSIIAELNKDEVGPVVAKDILSFVKREKLGIVIDTNALNEALEKLFHHDMLNKDGATNAYTFKMDLWRRWMARMHSIWQVIDEVKSSEEGLGEGIVPASEGRRRKMILGTAGAVLLAFAFLWGKGFFGGTVIQDGRSLGAAALAPVDSTWISVATNPSGAFVFLGERRIGKSPIEHWPVQVGTTPIRIELAGFVNATDTFELRKDEPLERTFELAEQTGRLRVDSSPPGAEVYVDGKRRGSTPQTLDNLPIRHLYKITLALAGYNRVRVEGVRVFEDSLNVVSKTLTTSTSQVHIVTMPEGARIEVDGESWGEAPQAKALGYGSHNLMLTLEGYEPLERRIDVPVANNRIDATLVKLPQGELVISVVPYANIYINNEMKTSGGGHYSAHLDPGTYTIRLEHPQLGTVEREVKVVSDQTTKRNIDMAKEGKQQ